MPPLNDNFFLPYQRRWIEDRSPLKIMEKSRQVGLSWASAYALVREQATQATSYDTWVSSRDELQAQLFIDDAARFADLLQTASRSYGRTFMAADGSAVTSRSLRFSSGRSIHALSSNPNAQAGKRGTRLLDEFALHPNPAELYAIALPGITWGGRLEIISTHRGENNFFNHLITEITQKGNPKNFSYHRVTLADALEQGFLPKLKSKLSASDPRQQMNEEQYFDYIRSQCADEASFQQEYCCNPAQNQRAFLSLALILAAQSAEPLPATPSGPLYIGADLGRTHDRTVFYILEKLGPSFFTRAIVTLHQQSFAAQEAALDQWLAHPLTRGCAIDATGLGRQFAERMQARYGPHRVQSIIFTEGSKAHLAYTLRRHFEQRTVSIPTDAALRDDLASVEQLTTDSGHLTLGAPHSTSGHADHFWALALALHAAPASATTPSITLPTLTRPNKTLL